ncbi:Lon protease-like protein [Deinococcus sp. HSC-46F16]|uniref:LON peptidase substrate-binding domain-containing protein n=1 Tax=Deinococcus sp. HSC-46F16 TaxID=2910968 RepID=UPI0020A0247D|nr:LON peptidase substrate-binding domain-containing protein [Deinococcus sp. HSC-46F16]MCP2013053.1 Lon protease-like protein [Deinococcus sp. HSC-46F16]
MSLPLFPLPNTVLFPGQVLPLYVFEPRYRELLARVQASGEPFGVVRLQPRLEGGTTLLDRIGRVGTLAHLLEAETHEDGTSSILVVGGERFRVREFDPTHAYLSAEVDLWPLDPDPRGTPAEEATARLLLSDLLRLHPAEAEQLRAGAPEAPLLLASYAAALLPLEAGEREEALRAPTLLHRLDRLRASVPLGARELN